MLYWRICACMYRLEYMYQCIRINPSESAKNVRTKYILRAKYVYCGWDLTELLRVSDCQFRSCNSPGFDPSILRHSEIWRAADEAVLNKVHLKKYKKSPCLFKYVYRCITVSTYKYMLVLAYLCVYVSAWIYVSMYKNLSYCNRHIFLFETHIVKRNNAKKVFFKVKQNIRSKKMVFPSFRFESWQAKWI